MPNNAKPLTSRSALPSDEDLRAWLRRAIATSGMRPTPFAKAAGIAPSTVVRALEDGGTMLERRTIRKIIETFNVPAPELGGAILQDGDLVDPEQNAASPFGAPLSHQFIKVVNTRVLDLNGLLPGDWVLLNRLLAPRDEDAVVAHVHRLGGVNPELVLRTLDHPYLITRACDPDLRAKPLLLDDHTVRIIATVEKVVRMRAAAT